MAQADGTVTPNIPKSTNPISPEYTTVDLGNGSSLVRVPDGYGGYEYKVVSNYHPPTGTQGDPQLAARQAFEAEQARLALAEKQRQFNEQFGADKARGDQQQQVTQGNLTGYYNGQNTLARDQLNQNQQQFDATQAFNQYKYLSELAANPRNFVQNFFARRGATPPPGVAQYGTQTPTQIMPFQQFLQGQTQQQANNMPQQIGRQAVQPPSGPMIDARPFRSPTGYQSPKPTTAIADFIRQATPAPTPATVRTNTVANFQPSGQTGATGTQQFVQGGNLSGMQLPDNVPASQALANAQANSGGLQVQTGSDGYTSMYDPNDDSRMGTPGVPQNFAYAKGGIVPEPVVGRGVISGQRYTFGEKGPEAVVPSNYLPDFLKSRAGKETMGGKAYYWGGDIGFDSGDGYQPAPDYSFPELQYQDPYIQPDPVYGTPPSSTDNGAANGGGPVYAGTEDDRVANPNAGNTGASAPSPSPTVSAPGGPVAPAVTEIPDPAASTVAPPPVTVARPPSTVAPPPPPAPPRPSTPGDPAGVDPVGVAPTSLPNPSNYLPSFVTQPLGLPQASNNFNATASTTNGVGIMPGQVAPAGTFNPQAANSYLPTFLPGEDQTSTLASLAANNAVPPFLSRIFAQQAGAQDFGTNQPQTYTLPRDVPIVSKLGFSQMAPSEQQALLSYVSSYGVTPEDYIAAIERLSPSGSSSRNPLFGSSFQYARQ
jgi:hypothetical protein